MSEVIIINFSRAYRCIVGVNHEERVKQQTLIVEIIFVIDASGETVDEIEFFLDQLIERAVNQEQFYLLERLAFWLGHLIAERWKRARFLQVVLKKPEALPSATNAFVSLIMKNF